MFINSSFNFGIKISSESKAKTHSFLHLDKPKALAGSAYPIFSCIYISQLYLLAISNVSSVLYISTITISLHHFTLSKHFSKYFSEL